MSCLFFDIKLGDRILTDVVNPIGGNMRLDKYLKVSRLIKRRSVANEACDAGRVTINDKVAKASTEVNIGDVIGIKYAEKTVTVKVLRITESIHKEDAKDMYELM